MEQEVLPYLEGEGGEGYGWAIATGRLRNPAHDLLTAQVARQPLCCDRAVAWRWRLC